MFWHSHCLRIRVSQPTLAALHARLSRTVEAADQVALLQHFRVQPRGDSNSCGDFPSGSRKSMIIIDNLQFEETIVKLGTACFVALQQIQTTTCMGNIMKKVQHLSNPCSKNRANRQNVVGCDEQ